MPGLSGGQRKLLLFELIYQRTASEKDLLIVLDEVSFIYRSGRIYSWISSAAIY